MGLHANERPNIADDHSACWGDLLAHEKGRDRRRVSHP
jgi:hypothetical protein